MALNQEISLPLSPKCWDERWCIIIAQLKIRLKKKTTFGFTMFFSEVEYFNYSRDIFLFIVTVTGHFLLLRINVWVYKITRFVFSPSVVFLLLSFCAGAATFLSNTVINIREIFWVILLEEMELSYSGSNCLCCGPSSMQEMLHVNWLNEWVAEWMDDLLSVWDLLLTH